MFDLDLYTNTNNWPQSIPLPLYTFKVTWFRGVGTSLISDVHIESAPSGF